MRNNLHNIIFTILTISLIYSIYTNYNEKKQLILNAVLSNNISAVKFLINNNFDINMKYNHSHTLLHSAALYGDINMVKLLVESGAKILENDFNLTPIDSASDFKHLDVVKYLQTKGAF
jgi:uncharacterized protein